jgi:hypothetical protein
MHIPQSKRTWIFQTRIITLCAKIPRLFLQAKSTQHRLKETQIGRRNKVLGINTIVFGISWTLQKGKQVPSGVWRPVVAAALLAVQDVPSL